VISWALWDTSSVRQGLGVEIRLLEVIGRKSLVCVNADLAVIGHIPQLSYTKNEYINNVTVFK